MPAAASHRFAPRSGREIALSTVLPFGLLDDRRIGSLLWVGEPVHCSLENGHCVASLTRRHRLWINIEFECPIIFVNEVTALTNIVVNIDDLVRSHGVGDALHINVSALLKTDRVFELRQIPGFEPFSRLREAF